MSGEETKLTIDYATNEQFLRRQRKLALNHQRKLAKVYRFTQPWWTHTLTKLTILIISSLIVFLLADQDDANTTATNGSPSQPSAQPVRQYNTTVYASNNTAGGYGIAFSEHPIVRAQIFESPAPISLTPNTTYTPPPAYTPPSTYAPPPPPDTIPPYPPTPTPATYIPPTYTPPPTYTAPDVPLRDVTQPP